ncbi:phosphate transport system regulatory protein PhoU [Desulfuromonas soudanensis]|uniref:Phosphate-specific transport system accessory protein PhoU n=1 Tax=Desulfuromonas soudanensis TaxID=1603606 RepID=A0A0M4CTX7_9BACT|nr:phosphate signaling complex protein PhoU [Desulfuromonas soudanensis]ALC14866.1 phosphate transport system regulatory protein PhoU [Desulfuromonas soudanensis]
MTQHMQRELDNLKKMILALSAVAEESVQKAARSIETLDVPLAEEVIGSDDLVDQMEVDLEEECLKILALHQPVAIDLRFIIAVLKINNDLERIADLAVNIAERAVGLSGMSRVEIPFDFAGMARRAETMLNMSLDALVQLDTGIAHQVIALDDEVDAMHSANYGLIKAQILARPETLDALIQHLSLSRHLERIADLATNIAEDVIYMIDGVIVRHSL